MKVGKKVVSIETPSNFKVVQQLLCLTVNLERKSINGYTELSIIPLREKLSKLYLNCGKEIKIFRITLDEFEAEFVRNHPLDNLKNDLDPSRFDLKHLSSQHFQACNKTDPDHGGGEIEIKIPEIVQESVAQLKCIKIGVEFLLDRPSVGVHFVSSGSKAKPNSSQQQQEGNSLLGSVSSSNQISTQKSSQFMFTYRSSGSGMSARDAFPCVDRVGEVCQWKLEISCDSALTAVSSGELTETLYTQDMRGKVFHYVLTTPTAPCNIGFAVGNFQIGVHPEMSEITSFCPPRLLPLLQHTTQKLDKLFEFFEELLASRYPYTSYKQVFVDGTIDDITSYAGLSILNVGVLYHKKMIDPIPLSRSLLANGIAQQFFGCFITPKHWLDFWICKGLSRYITGLFMQKYFGHNEYMFHISRTLQSVTEYEMGWGPITLRPLSKEQTAGKHLHFDPRSPLTVSANYVDIMGKKAHLVMRMLEKRLGKELLLQVLNKMLWMGGQTGSGGGRGGSLDIQSWENLLVSTESFFLAVSNVTGQDFPSFMEQWVYGGGHALFLVNYNFNRKRNSVELEIKQEPDLAKGRMLYVGPVTIVIQELDGSFSHTIQIDDALSKHDISCHSKARRQRKRKIPLQTQEEVDMDLGASDPDSPVLWVRFDPDLLMVRKVDIRQPEFHWQYQVKYEKDILAQLMSLDYLPRFPSAQTRFTLTEVLDNHQIFYRVRMQAAFCMAEVANKLQGSWMGPPAMLNMFRKHFGSHSNPNIPRPNNFNNLQMYFIMTAVPSAMALLRSSPEVGGAAPGEVVRFLRDLIKLNDNSTNKYSDDYYRANLLSALVQSTPHNPAGAGANADSLSVDVAGVVEELCLALNLEKTTPSCGRVITVACLKAFRILQNRGHIPIDPTLFAPYLKPGQYQRVRQGAIDCMIDVMIQTGRIDILEDLLRMMRTEEDLSIRYYLITRLSLRPPFTHKQMMAMKLQGLGDTHELNNEEMVKRVHQTILSWTPDVRARTSLIDMYANMFGRKETPLCLRKPPPPPPAPPASSLPPSMPFVLAGGLGGMGGLGGVFGPVNKPGSRPGSRPPSRPPSRPTSAASGQSSLPGTAQDQMQFQQEAMATGDQRMEMIGEASTSLAPTPPAISSTIGEPSQSDQIGLLPPESLLEQPPKDQDHQTESMEPPFKMERRESPEQSIEGEMIGTDQITDDKTEAEPKDEPKVIVQNLCDDVM